jgi:membrane protein YdbS with pleckstrin-like domain
MLKSRRILSLARTSAEETSVHEPEASSSRRKLQLLASFVFFLLMAIGVGCHGFFVDPTLTSVSVQTLESTSLINVGTTVQLQATGTYDDGSHKNLTGHAVWSVTANPDFVTVSPGGLVTATKVTPAGTTSTVQAAAQSSNGLVVSGTISIALGQSTSLVINSTPSSPISLATAGTGSTVQFAASLNGNDVTSRTTFTSSSSTIINIPSGSTAGTLGGTSGTVTITGTNSTDGATGTLQVRVTQ